MATEESQLMTKVMPKKTVGVNLQSSLSVESSSLSTVQDFARNCYTETSTNDSSSISGIDVDGMPLNPIQKTCLKEKTANAIKSNKETELTEQNKSSALDSSSSSVEESESKNDGINADCALLKKQTGNALLPDHSDFFARSAFSLILNAKGTEPQLGLTELSSTACSSLTGNLNLVQSKTETTSKKQNLKLNVPLTSAKCLPNSNVSRLHPKDDSEVNLSMPSSVYGTKLSNIECVLIGLSLDKKKMSDKQMSDPQIEQQMVHLAGGSVNLISNVQDDMQDSDSICSGKQEKCNDKSIKQLEGKTDAISKVTDNNNYFSSQKQILETLQENQKNSVNYSSVLNTTGIHDNLKLYNVQKTTKTQSLEQHISKLIAQNAAIVDTLNPIRPRHYVRHLSFSEPVNEREHRKSSVTSKLRRFSEDLSSTVNNTSYLVNKSKLQIALMGHSDSGIINCKNLDLVPEHKDISASYPYTLNGTCYTISENEKAPFSPQLSTKLNVPEERDFIKPVSRLVSNEKLVQVDDKFSNEFTGKHEKLHRKSESSIIKDLLLKPKHGRLLQSSVSSAESILPPQLNIEAALSKQKANELHVCKFCNISFLSKDNLEAHQLHYCKLRNQPGVVSKSSASTVFSSKEQPLLEKVNDASLVFSYDTSSLSDDRLNTTGMVGAKSFGNDEESWIPPLKQRKLSEPVLSKSHIENNVNRRRTTELLRSDKNSHCIPSASGGWNSQMCGGQVQVFDEIGNKHISQKSNIHNQTSLFTLLGAENRHSFAFSESGSWVNEGGKLKKSSKTSSLPTVVVTISKPELNSGGTVMQVHSSMAASGSSLSVQMSSQAPLMATGSPEMAKWKGFQPDISFGTKMDLSPISKSVANESERLSNIVEQSPSHCDTPKSLVIESPGTSPLSEVTECGSPSSTQSSILGFGKQERSPVRKIGRSENRDYEFSSALGISLNAVSTSTTLENAVRKNNSDSSSTPLFCIPDGPSAVFNCISVFDDSTTTTIVDSISIIDEKVKITSPPKIITESQVDNAKNKCANPSRPTFLPLKKGITLVGSTLISPETPRPKKSSIQLYLGGHAYTSLGLKCSTRSTYCCIYRPQPMYVPQDTDPKLSMYSNWQVVPSKEELLGMTPSQLLGLYNSHQKKESCRLTFTIAKIGHTLVCTHSSYWTFRMQDATKEDALKHSKIVEKGSEKDIEDKAQLESLAIPVEMSLVSAMESTSFMSKEQGRLDENSSTLLKENSRSHSEDTAEESRTSHSSSHTPEDSVMPNPPKRAHNMEGAACTTVDEGTYVRGRGWGKYICEECGIRCKKPSVLKKHIRTHTNLRPYKCYHCAFAFKTKGNLTKHMKSKAHFKKCIELGVVPVPTTVDDSQIDEEALDKQEKLDKDICPSLNTQEFEDGEEIDDDADDSDHTDNEEEDDGTNDTQNSSERSRETKSLKELEQNHSSSEKEFPTTRDMTEKEGEAAQSLLHLSTCSVSQPSQRKSSTRSLSSGLMSIDHSEDSQSSSVLGSEVSIIQNSSSCITDFEDALSNAIASKGTAASLPSNPLRSPVKVAVGSGFVITDASYPPDQFFPENRLIDRKSSSFENISALSFRVTSPNSDYRERPQTMWTTTSPQSWQGHSSLSVFPNSHVKHQAKGVIWDGQLLDTGMSKPVQFVVDTDQPIDLRVSKTKERIPEETNRLTSFEDWRLSQNMGTDHVVVTENSKSCFPVLQDKDMQCSKVDVHSLQEQQMSYLQRDDVSPKSVEDNVMRPVETVAVTECQDSKNYAKPTSCHENSIPSYNVGRSEPTFDPGVNIQSVQFELPSKPADDSVDTELQPTCPISPISPPAVEDTVNQSPVMFHENSAASSHNVSKSDSGTPQRQRECLGKNGALRNSYVSEGKCTCAICNKTFTKPSQLRLHVNIHYFERPFRCDDCAISFRTNGHLEKHKRSASHYNKLHTNTSFGTPCADNPRPFKCSDCNIAFRMHGHLAKHLRSKMHIMKLECLGKLPFGMYAEMERTGVNFNDIDTTDCDNSLESLQEIAQHLYTPSAQQSMELSTQSVQTTKPKPHFFNSSYSSATPLQIINSSSSSFSSEMQQINPASNLNSLSNSDGSRKVSQEKALVGVSDRAGVECRTAQKEYLTNFTHLDASAQPHLHPRTCPCDSCISSKMAPFSGLADSCATRPVKKEQWKLKDRLIAEFQEESTHIENPR